MAEKKLKIVLVSSLSGPNYTYSPGDIAEFPTGEAARLIEAGIARPFRAVNDMEKAGANKPRPRKRK
ncbi:MAG: hypothetical protein CMF31_05080 [Kordiimonas sp.]|nr:hypothetical protein [Kordiimonas sp.]